MWLIEMEGEGRSRGNASALPGGAAMVDTAQAGNGNARAKRERRERGAGASINRCLMLDLESSNEAEPRIARAWVGFHQVELWISTTCANTARSTSYVQKS